MEQNKKEEIIQNIASLTSNRYTSTLNNKLERVDSEMNRAADAIKILGLLKVAAQLIDSHADEIKAEQTNRINGLFEYISTNENIKNFKITKRADVIEVKLNFNELVINKPETIKYLCETYSNYIPASGDFCYNYEQNPDEAINNYELYHKNGSLTVELQTNPFNIWYVDFCRSVENGFNENNLNEIYDKIRSLTINYADISEDNVIEKFINSDAVSLITGDTLFNFTLDMYSVGCFKFKNYGKYQDLASAPLSVIIDNICDLNNVNLIYDNSFRSAFRCMSVRKKGVIENANNYYKR